MILGTSQIDITPKPGVQLSGFAARIQPSAGVLDPLFAKGFYLEDKGTKLLWLHCDLVGFDRSIVESFRVWALGALNLQSHQVMLSATHTHAGPCTIHLREAGEYDPVYVEFLQLRLREAANCAIANTEEVNLVTVEGHLALAVDRRKAASSHTDPRVAALGFRRPDGTFAAAIMNYAIHPVALGPANRHISADISGQAALSLAQQLPGNPVVFMTNGASANLNPPAENVDAAKVSLWGGEMAASVGSLLKSARPKARPHFEVSSRTIQLPLDVLDASEINRFAEGALQNDDPLGQWGDKYRRVVEHWRSTLLAASKSGKSASHRDAELFAVGLGDIILLGVNAEVFSEFTDWLRSSTGKRVYLIGYANGDMGYLPTRAAYAEGGYEVEVAHLFYGGFRPREGGLELLAHEATNLLGSLGAVGEVRPGAAMAPRSAAPSP